MFLTTNRGSTFDVAFKSRKDLNAECQLFFLGLSVTEVGMGYIRWTRKQFLYLYGSDLAKGDLDELANLKLIGPEIKNAAKTSRLLAKRKGSPLTI